MVVQPDKAIENECLHAVGYRRLRRIRRPLTRIN
jgi:hypothetical protein